MVGSCLGNVWDMFRNMSVASSGYNIPNKNKHIWHSRESRHDGVLGARPPRMQRVRGAQILAVSLFHSFYLSFSKVCAGVLGFLCFFGFVGFLCVLDVLLCCQFQPRYLRLPNHLSPTSQLSGPSLGIQVNKRHVCLYSYNPLKGIVGGPLDSD